MMSRGVINNCCSYSPKITVIWLISACTFYFFFQMALRNSSSHDDSNPNRSAISATSRRSPRRRTMCTGLLYSSYDNSFMNHELKKKYLFYLQHHLQFQMRSIDQYYIYAKMAKDLDENGAVFLQQGETSQSLSLSDLFTLKDGTVTQAANPPVRANVLHLSPDYSIAISESVKSILLPYFGKETEIEGEASAIKIVAETICPLNIVLDRVVLTSTGVLLGCWQVVSGTDPSTIPTKLKTALPRSPEKQLYNQVMLHTSFARLLGHPNNLPEEVQKVSGLQIFHELVSRVNNQIRGMKATVSELWYVEEYDVLALAQMKIRKFHFGCSNARHFHS